MKFGIIGLGRVGLSLSLYLKEKNFKFLWWTKSDRKRKEYKSIIGESLSSPHLVFENSDLIFICIKDDEIENFIKGIDLKYRKMAVHLSGSLPLSVLNPLKERGFYTGSFHPIQSFSFPSSFYFKDIYASFVGDEEIYKVLKKVFNGDIKIIKVNEEKKFLIHLASTISSNFFVFLLRESEEILKKGDLSLEILFPLIKTTFENIKKEGVYKALTGPAKRKDYHTLLRHEKYLYENFKSFFRIYLEITREILKNETS